jgi:hypothetical protein
MSPNILVWPTIAPRATGDEEETILDEEDENNSILEGNGCDDTLVVDFPNNNINTLETATTSTNHPHTPVTIITNTPPRRLQLWNLEQEDNHHHHHHHHHPDRTPWPILRIPIFGESSASSSSSLRYNSYWSDTESSSSSSPDDEDSKSGYDPSGDDDGDDEALLYRMESDAAQLTPRRPRRQHPSADLHVYFVHHLDVTEDHTTENQGIDNQARQPSVILLPRIEGDPTADSWITTTATTDDPVLQVRDHAETWNEETRTTLQDPTSTQASSDEPYATENRQDDPLRAYNQTFTIDALSEQLTRRQQRILYRRHSMCSSSNSSNSSINSNSSSGTGRDLPPQQESHNTSLFMAMSSQHLTTQRAIQASFLAHRRHSMGCIPLLAV